MRSLADESINLIVTSTPYNLLKEYEKRSSIEQYCEKQASCIAEAVRVLAPNCSICGQLANGELQTRPMNKPIHDPDLEIVS